MPVKFSVATLAATFSMFRANQRHHKGDLMTQIHEQRTIAASPERVFAWLLELGRPLLRCRLVLGFLELQDRIFDQFLLIGLV